MARRQSAFEDLMHMASRLPWHVGLILAVVAALVFHGLAALLPSRGETAAALGVVVVRGLYGTIASVLQFIVPLGFLVGSLVSFLKRSHAATLFAQVSSGPAQSISQITWTQFERVVGETFRRRGYKVTETGGGGSDGGVDLVLLKDGRHFLVQCKQWRTQRVGVTTVRELYGVVAARAAAGGIVVTCGGFTAEARQFAERCRIELIDGDALKSVMHESGRATIEHAASSAGPAIGVGVVSSVRNHCPKCGSAMARRTARRGPRAGRDFLGCTRYPLCRGIRELDGAPLA